MSEAISTTIVSAIIAGVFTLVSKRMELGHSRNNSQINETSLAIPRTTTDTLNYGTVLKHVGILQFALNIVGFILGLGMGLIGASQEAILVVLLLLGTFLLIIGFIWSGLSVNKAVLWKHVTAVAVGIAITTLLINSIVLQTSISALAIFVAFAQSFMSMGIGGVIAYMLKR